MKITLPERDIEKFEIENYKLNFQIDPNSTEVDTRLFQKYALPILNKHLVKVFKLYSDEMHDTIIKRFRFKYIIEKIDKPNDLINDLNIELQKYFYVARITYLKQGTDYMLIIWFGKY